MKKLITATAAAAFILAAGSAMAEDTSENTPTQKTPTQEQIDTNASSGASTTTQTPAGTTGAGVNSGADLNAGTNDADMKAGANVNGSVSEVPGKPTDTIKESTDSK
jgi:hypothetical protein